MSPVLAALWALLVVTAGWVVWLTLRLDRVEIAHRDDAALWQGVQDKLLRCEQRLDERRVADQGKRARRKEA